MDLDLKPTTKIGVLLDRYPFLVETLAAYAPEFARLRAPLARKTFGRLASIADAARMGGVELEPLFETIRSTIAAHSGHPATGQPATGKPAAQGLTPGEGPARQEQPAAVADQAYRIDELKAIIRELHAGRSPEEMAERFGKVLERVSAAEIAETEQQLVAEGMPVTEVQALCDVHAAVFRRGAGQETIVTLPAGHPLQALAAANREIARVVDRLRGAIAEAGDPPSSEAFAMIQGKLELGLGELVMIDGHYLKKEYRLFPVLERHGAEAPPQVMWAVHDDIRAKLKAVRESLRQGDSGAVGADLPKLLDMVTEMIFKEERILFSLCMEVFDPADWEGLDLAGDPVVDVDPHAAAAYYRAARRGTSGAVPEISLATGAVTAEQLDLIMNNLPFDLTYVDEDDRVRYYSEGQRVFPRTPEIIGRKVQNCHPPNSVNVVQQIVESFRRGDHDVAEFWLEYRGSFVHIRYTALRDPAGNYRGVLEVVQDATGVRSLTGERRLLDWSPGTRPDA